MSSPLGQIDPNIIALNRNLRAQQQAQQQAEQAQLDAQHRAELEQAKAEAEQKARQNTVSTRRSDPNVFFNEKTGQYEFIVQPTYDDPYGSRAVSKSDVNPNYFNTDAGKALGKQFDELQAKAETAQDFAIFKNLEAQGLNPGQLSITRDASGKIIGGSGTNNNIRLNPSSDNSTIQISYGNQPIAAPSVEPAVFGSLSASQGKTAFSNPYRPDMSATERGYAQLQAAQQQVGEYYTKPIFGTLTASQAANSLYIQNEKVQEDTMKANLNAAVTKHYQVNLEDRLSGGPYRYEVQLSDSLSGNQQNRPFTQADNTKPAIPTSNDPLAGAAAGFQNLYETIRSRVTNTEPKSVPDAEGDIYGALIGLGKRAIVDNQPANVNLLLFTKEIGDIGTAIQEKPGYYAGNIAASAATWAASFIVPPLASSKIITPLLGAARAGRAAEVLKPLGNVVQVEKDLVNVGKEGDALRYSVGRYTTVGKAKEPAIEFFTRQVAQSGKDFIQPTERTTQYVSTTVQGTKEGKLDIPTSKQLFEVKGGQLNYPEVGAGARGETLYSVAKPETKAVATSETFTLKELKSTLSTPEGIKKVLGTTDDFVRITGPRSPTAARPFVPAAGGEVTEQFLKEAKILPSSAKGSQSIIPTAAAASSNLATRVLGAQNTSKPLVSLGFGGATGAERVRGKARGSETEEQFFRTPPKSDSIAKQFMQQFTDFTFAGKQSSKTQGGQGGRSNTRSLDKAIEKNLQSVILKDIIGTNERPLFELGSITGEITTPITGQTPITQPITTPITGLITIPTETPIPRYVPPRMPPIIDIPGFGGTTRKKKSGKGRKTKHGEKTYRANDILKSFSPFLAEALKGIRIE